MENFFVILGGMGTMATESFIHLLNERTPAHCDQEYLNYIVCNHATIPDRTAYILDNQKENPLLPLKEDVQSLSRMQPNFFVLTCNTAHYFHDALQKETSIPIIHMPKLAANRIRKMSDQRPFKVMILATMGTIQSQVYEEEFASDHNIEVMIPNEALQNEVMALIYHDVKERQYINETRYHQILKTAAEQYHCDAMILGCTELSLMEEKCPNHNYCVVDAQAELVDEVLRLTKKN